MALSLRQLVRRLSHPVNAFFRKISYPRAVIRNAPITITPRTVDMFANNSDRAFTQLTPSFVSQKCSIHTTSSCFSEHIFNIQDSDDFKKRVLQSKLPTIVDFYATWCGPCKLLIPKLEQIVAKNQGKVVLAKIDIDVLTELADSYQVSAVPTVIAMKNGKELDKFVGFKDDAMLESFVENLLK